MSEKILGRKKEIKLLDEVWKSKEAEFLTVYGRRRVGKTYLIRQYFSEKASFYLEASGAKDQSLKVQLENFMKAISKTFFKGIVLATPNSWNDAFDILTRELECVPKSQKIVIFLDELPWMAVKRSGLLQSLDYYWNLHWSKLPNLILAVCGSAASWMLEKLIHAKGGLHKRITRKLLLEPFSLKETEIFLKGRGIPLNQKQILDIYMAIGGVPFYLKSIQKGMSATQNIDTLCFDKNGMLYDEFKNLFASLFDYSEINLNIVREIVKHGNSISREKLTKVTGISSGGTLNKRINELEAAGFLQSYFPYGRRKRDRFYRVIDEFSLFHLKWIEPYMMSGFKDKEHQFWQNLVKTPAVSSWSGLAFEAVCFKHISQIKRGLGLEKIACNIGSWQYLPKKEKNSDGIQIDLLLDRQDGVITLVEIKYSERQFVLEKSYAKKLLQKIEVFEKQTGTPKQIFLALVTTMGLKKSFWSDEIIHQTVTLKDFFN